MGSFLGHLLPGIFFLLFGLWSTIKYQYRHVMKHSRTTKGCCRTCNMDLIEGIAKIICPSFGILMEQVTNNGPKFHLTNSNNEFLDGNNWSHCTMYMFFIFAGIADILTLKVSKYTPKGINHLAFGLALSIEGYLFYFHTHGRTMLEIRIHVLLVVAIWTGAGVLAILWYIDAHHAKGSAREFCKLENGNGYVPLLTDHYEETILLDKTKPQENLAKEATNSIAQESPLSLPINTLISQVLQAAKHQDKDMSAVQLTLQMIVTASLLLQGTWFIQIATILYPPGKNGWNEESKTNIEFATVFFAWHLATIIVFLAIAYSIITVILSSKVRSHCNTHI